LSRLFFIIGYIYASLTTNIIRFYSTSGVIVVIICTDWSPFSSYLFQFMVNYFTTIERFHFDV